MYFKELVVVLNALCYDQGGMHNRVRRMMVRRRGGGERYGFFRESQVSQQDSSVDPLSELLSHLGKRLFIINYY